MDVRSRGYTLLELLLVVTLLAVIGGSAVPLTQSGVEQARTAGAASYVSGRLAAARLAAVRRSAYVAIRFRRDGESYFMQFYVDGNGNGVLTQDIGDGIDVPVSAEERLDSQFSGVVFGILPSVTGIDPSQPFDAADPIQIGNTSLLSFSPIGSATSGTLFIRGHRQNQYAVRVLGATGRTRVLRFNFERATWLQR